MPSSSCDWRNTSIDSDMPVSRFCAHKKLIVIYTEKIVMSHLYIVYHVVIETRSGRPDRHGARSNNPILLLVTLSCLENSLFNLYHFEKHYQKNMITKWFMVAAIESWLFLFEMGSQR